VREYVGGYSDWLRQRRVAPEAAHEPKSGKPAASPPAEPKKPAARKLSYKDQRELDQLPARIEQLETEQTALHVSLADPELYRRDPAALKKVDERTKQIEAELRQVYARWEQLEAQRSGE